MRLWGISPHSDHFAATAQTRSDLIIARVLSSEQNHFAADGLKTRQRISACSSFKVDPFGCRQQDFIWAPSGHCSLSTQINNAQEKSGVQGLNTLPYLGN